jgi:HK97 family phage portal protein
MGLLDKLWSRQEKIADTTKGIVENENAIVPNETTSLVSKNKVGRSHGVINEFQKLANILAEKDFNIVRDSTAEDGSGFWESEVKAYIDSRNLKNLYFSEDWPFITMDLIALKISNQRLVVMRDEATQEGKKEAKKVDNHPYQKTLDNPNPYQDYHAWMYCVVVDLIAVGNAIVWKGMTALNLWQIPSDEIFIDFLNDGRISEYRRMYTDQNGMLQIKTRFNPNEIIHIRRPNPNSLYWGLSPFVPGRKSVLFNRYSSEYLVNYYVKGTTPGLALEMTEIANETVALRLLKSFEMAYTGRKNQRRTMVLPKGVTVKNVATSLADQQLKDYIDQNRETIIALLKVPPHEVGLQTQGSLGSEEYKQALKNFWASTILPTQKMIAGALTTGLKEQLGEGYYLGFDNDDVEILKDDKIKKAELAQAMKSTHTVNEIRLELYDKDPIEGGDVLAGAQQQPMFPFSLSMQAPTNPVAVEGKDYEAESLDNNSAEILIKAHKDWFTARQDKITTATTPTMKDMIELSIDMFMNQGEKIVEGVSKQLKEKAIQKPNDKTIRKTIENAIDSYRVKWIDNYTKILTTNMNFGYGLSIDAPFKLPAEDEIIAIGDNSRNERNDILKARGIRAFDTMKATTTNEVMDMIAEGIKKQSTIQQLTEKIATKFTNADNIMYRAERIARTETLTAVSMGQGAAMADAKKLMPDLQKMWISTNDERTRGNPGGLYGDVTADHWHLHGQIVDSEQDFTDTKSGDKLAFPRDPRGQKSSTINCRCTFVMMPKSDMDKFRKDSQAKPN